MAQKLLNGHARSGVLAIPRQDFRDGSVQAKFSLGGLQQNECGSELLGDGSDAEFGLRRIWYVRLHVGIADASHEDDFAVFSHQYGAIEVTIFFVYRNEPADAFGFSVGWLLRCEKP